MTKNITLISIVLALLLAGCSKTYTDSVAATEITLEENQKLVYGQIETITGNDMTLALATASEAETNNSDPDSPGTDISMSQTSTRMPPEAMNGEPGSDMSGNTGSVQGDNRGSQEPGFADSESEKSQKNQMPGRITYTLSGEKMELRIPVGTTVTTSLGTTTTFSRLAAGDMLKLVLETSNDGSETITSIWIVG